MILDKSKIKAIIFDWGGVCCKEGEPFASLDLQHTLKMNQDQIAVQVREIYNGYYIGKYNRDSFWLAIMNHFGLTETPKINPIVLSGAYLNSYKIFQEVLDIVLKLHARYQVGLLSNLTPEMRDCVRPRYQTSRYFQTELYSCDLDVAMMKPDSRVYDLILKRMQIDPKECLFIDNSQQNLVPAEALGMQTIFFESLNQFLKEIKVLL